eukprot:2110967-Rhodomonas_salina.8
MSDVRSVQREDGGSVSRREIAACCAHAVPARSRVGVRWWVGVVLAASSSCCATMSAPAVPPANTCSGARATSRVSESEPPCRYSLRLIMPWSSPRPAAYAPKSNTRNYSLSANCTRNAGSCIRV